ncbi:glucuronate isomerase [Rhizobium mesoamericanum]|uniref:Uronate isomerase n=1 Tax=Rhizobium mesoamericanum STM3625 TaxID=1211777 RepID=K0Q4R4_9HYPH|nr:glucuronate isomerase [Rhizobium mesoamericanum]CCM78009.1 Uronate isomerase [Rhizobium mesoamericanum STM3625]
MDVGNGFLHPDRLFPADPATRAIARELYETVRALPIVSPHGHTEPSWFADDEPFEDASSLLVIPDHYLFRMLHSVSVKLDDLGVPRLDGKPVAKGRDIWRAFAAQYHLFRGTPSSLWVDHAMSAVLGCEEPLKPENADALYDHINAQLALPEFRPRALHKRFGIETIATTEGALDPLVHHQKMAQDGWIGRVRTTYRPDSVTDPDAVGFRENLVRLGELTDCDVTKWDGLIDAHRKRRAYFRQYGATATDHGVPTAFTADLPLADKQRLLDKAHKITMSAEEAELFRGQMLTEMAGLSAEDGMTMQIHAGSRRNTDRELFRTRGPNMGADIPTPTDWVGGLSAMLAKYGHAPGLRVLLFTLDETTYARELAPMAGHWPCLMIGPPWWFHDSPNGIRRYLDQVVETAGFANLAGFNDDTRALLSIPARHDVWRREVCRFLAQFVTEHRMTRQEAEIVAGELSYGNAKKAYKL